MYFQKLNKKNCMGMSLNERINVRGNSEQFYAFHQWDNWPGLPDPLPILNFRKYNKGVLRADVFFMSLRNGDVFLPYNGEFDFIV